MDRDNIIMLLIARTERHKGIGSAYVYIENADALYVELRAKGEYSRRASRPSVGIARFSRARSRGQPDYVRPGI